jgi:signal peptidase II
VALTAAVLLSSAVVTLLLDQMSKAFVTSRLEEGERVELALRSGVRRVTNPRGGRLALSEREALGLWLLMVACLGLFIAVRAPLPSAGAVGLGLVVGGAGGNLADRLRHGGVLDFIAVGRWPTFNLADAALVVGSALAAWSLR